ncbi:PBP1A family penicillin-binding protein [Bacillus carboniphilus]|uniref:PBP1A family penicillin-binding protein n=1 Tax=Bacillus carboniphilus TaxID=86663 RepID=A0ABY9JQS3_9BACI|nr:PBP1A family penicillin-binding protein [Bacillus carboniphilus]WLR41749.1 PBP1A family penicillin-binding protein [Bacillus carboniphilus]
MEVITTKRFKKTVKLLRAFLFLSAIATTFFLCLLLVVIIIAKIQGPPSLFVPQSTIIYAEDEQKIGETTNQKRYWVPLDQISTDVINATIATEDRKFYQHHGFDIIRMGGAVIADLKAMAKVQGASTITQQYARNLFLSNEKTWVRKVKEAFYTVRLELNYEKDEILEGYLNTIYYGHGLYGIEAASLYYFNKHAHELTVAESALLAGIPKGPSYYSPETNFEKAKNRQERVLQSMYNEEFITKAQFEEALNEKIVLNGKTKQSNEMVAPYFQVQAIKQAADILNVDREKIDSLGLKIYTSLNLERQQIAEKYMKQIFADESTIQLGFLAMDPLTGKVEAMIGGRDYEESQFNRAIQAKRQPGSTIKPFLYYGGIKEGVTPVTPLRSEPTVFTYDDGRKKYQPSNYHDYYAYDDIDLMHAIALSDNIYAVKMHMFLGMDTLTNSVKEFGVQSPIKEVPSAALGTSPVTLIEMVNGYGHFANGGKEIEPVFVTKIEDTNGQLLYEFNPITNQKLDPKTTFVTTHLMTGMFDSQLNDYTKVTGSGIADLLTHQYAGKSGSTQTDSWMIGFSQNLVAGVWTGYDDPKEIESSEETQYAKKMWAYFMEEALKEDPPKEAPIPDGVVGVMVNVENGLLATEACPVSRLTYFIEGTEPENYCKEHLFDQLPTETQQLNENKERSWLDLIPFWP